VINTKAKSVRLKYSEKNGIQFVISIIVIFGVLFSLLPLFITIMNSVKSHVEIRLSIFSFPISFVTDNFVTAFSLLESGILNSVFVATVGSMVRVIFASVIAYMFVRKEFMGKEFFFTLYITMMMIPSILGISVLYDFMYKIKLINSYFGLWLPYVAGGQAGAMFLFRIFFKQQPEAIFEAAKIDGANDFYIFIVMVVPLAFPIMLYAFLGGFSSYYNDYLWPALVLKSEDKLTLMTVLLRSSSLYDSTNLGVVYAMYLISGIPLIITSSISLKFFQSGDFASGMKL